MMAINKRWGELNNPSKSKSMKGMYMEFMALNLIAIQP
jgi:hypothetical protein